jgi:hypothetical protein
MEKFLNELLTFIDKKTDWKVNNDTTNSQVITEFLYRNKELTAKFIASVGKPDSDTEGGLHLACVNARAFVESCGNLAEYVDGSKIAHRFKKFTVPVIEYNELRPKYSAEGN